MYVSLYIYIDVDIAKLEIFWDKQEIIKCFEAD